MIKFVWHPPTLSLEHSYNLATMRANCANEELHPQHIPKKQSFDKGAPRGQHMPGYLRQGHAPVFFAGGHNPQHNAHFVYES